MEDLERFYATEGVVSLGALSEYSDYDYSEVRQTADTLGHGHLVTAAQAEEILEHLDNEIEGTDEDDEEPESSETEEELDEDDEDDEDEG